MATFIISLCAILMLTTVSGLICRKAQLPEVIGQILVGILVGPSLLGVMHMSDSLSLFSDLASSSSCFWAVSAATCSC